MAEIIFNYEGNEIMIHCDIYEKMEDIIYRFLVKANINKNENNKFIFFI